MATKLNQILAIQSGRKTHTKEAFTAAYHQIQKPDLMSGISRVYKPKDDLGEVLPPESKLIQVKANEVIAKVELKLIELFDIVLTQDNANCDAKADVEVDGKVIANDVPVTYLLFLEKQLIDLNTFLEKIPVLDPTEIWNFDPSLDCYVSEPSQTTRTKKVPRNHVKYEATKEHPAQVEMFHEDVIVGTWTTKKFSGAVTATWKNAVLDRIRALSDAVKKAREEANSIVVQYEFIGEQVLNYVLKG